MQKRVQHYAGRRKFVSVVSKSIGLCVFMAAPVVSLAEHRWKLKKATTVGYIINLFIREIPSAPFEKTVDTLKSGELTQEVTGIITTMFATLEVIQQAINLGANFIIAHEPTFYNHTDETAWLENDDVYRYKADLLKKHRIAVWRCHDYIHAHRPDGVMTGVIKALGWEGYSATDGTPIFTMPAASVKDIVAHVKARLDISTLRYAGDLLQPCRRILLLPGAAGGKAQISAINRFKPDLVICGELSEWETAEYIRDARIKGDKIALLILGHTASEEPGLEWMVGWLKKAVPGMNVKHVPAKNPLSFI